MIYLVSMQVFELHFNPKVKEDLIFESFCYEPENIYEKKLGSLYIVGELKNTLPQNSKLLDKIAQIIKGKYYTPSFRSPEKALKESLKRANEFLAQELKKENVSWLGNLTLAVLSIKNLSLNFTKVGNLKILLSREGQISDIGSRLEFEEIEPYPLKIFSNIVSGKLAQNDRFIILTKEVFPTFAEGPDLPAKDRAKMSREEEFFSSKSLLDQIAKTEILDGKKMKEIFKSKEKKLLEISGICFITQVQREIQPKYALTFQKRPERFSLSQIFAPWRRRRLPVGLTSKAIKKVNFASFFKLNKIKFPKIRGLPSLLSFRPFQKTMERLRQKAQKTRAIFISLKRIPKLVKRKFNIPVLFKNLILAKPRGMLAILWGKPSLKKKAGLIFILIFILLIGFFIFKEEKAKEIELTQDILNKIEVQVAQAENFLILKDEKQANILLQKAWDRILPQTEIETPLKEEALLLKKTIEENLKNLNKLEKIENPEVLRELNPEESDIEHKKTLYSFSGSALLFLPPNIILSLRNEAWQEKNIQLPKSDFNLDIFSSYLSNLYFLDTKSGEITKYPYLGNLKWESPQLWLNPQTKKAIGAKSMAIDGGIWVLTTNGEIDRYFASTYKETLTLSIFPYLKNPTKIWTSPSHSYLYLLEPAEKRIVILTKQGGIVKQYQSDEFDNLLDFAVSQDAQTIWLLNGLKIYQITI